MRDVRGPGSAAAPRDRKGAVAAELEIIDRWIDVGGRELRRRLAQLPRRLPPRSDERPRDGLFPCGLERLSEIAGQLELVRATLRREHEHRVESDFRRRACDLQEG